MQMKLVFNPKEGKTEGPTALTLQWLSLHGRVALCPLLEAFS